MQQPAALQPKLEVGAVDDPLEHEADAVADRVMRMADPAVSVASAAPMVSRKCAACEAEEKAAEPAGSRGMLQRKCAACDAEERAQRKPAGPGDGTGGGAAPPIVHEVLRAPGQPLDAATRAYFEPRFGFAFDRVRVHADATAAESAQALGARAYTVGPHVAFATGAFAPHGDAGRLLLAHELAHVVQQGSAGPDRGAINGPSPAAAVVSAKPDATLVRRACDPKAIGAATGCAPATETPPLQPSNPFLIKFELACDSFETGEESRLRVLALGMRAAATVSDLQVRLDGFASEEGDQKFNRDLSCARATKVAAILTAAGIKSSDIALHSHGATAGDRPSHRSVLISAATVSPPTPVPVPPQPIPVPIPQPTPTPTPTPVPKPPDVDMWPKFRRPSMLDRLKKRLQQLKDMLKHGADILDDLDDLAHDVFNRIVVLTSLAVGVGAVVVGADNAEIVAEIEGLKKLLQEIDALRDSLPQTKPTPREFPPGEGRGSRDPDFDKPAPEPEPKPEDKKPEEKKPEEKKPEDKKPEDKPKETCATKYPDLIRCESLPSIYNVSAANCPSASAAGLKRLQTRETIPLTRGNQDAATSGPCVGRGGQHFNVQRGKFYIGAIVCCPCCHETLQGPKQECRCAFIRKRGNDRIPEPFP